MKIAIVNTHLRLGGIRQSLLNLLEALKGYNLEIDLYILTGKKDEIEQIVQPLGVHSVFILKNTDIYYKTLKEQASVSCKFKKIIYGSTTRLIGREHLLKVIIECEKLPDKYYDVVIAYANGIWSKGSRNFTGGCEYVAGKLVGNEKLAWIHSNPINLGFTDQICKRVYSQFDYVVNVSYGCKDIFDNICPSLKDKSIVVYNLCGSERVRQLMGKGNPYMEGFNIVTVARLDNKSKRLDRLALCCKILKEHGKTFKWHVVGDGNDMGLLRDMQKEYHLEDYLIIEGRKNNPYPYMKNADLYVCTSAYEAFSMVIRESFICGTPVVTTPIPPAKEIIRNEKNGLVCDGFDSNSIVLKIEYLMDNLVVLDNMRTYIAEQSKDYTDDITPFFNLLEGMI